MAMIRRLTLLAMFLGATLFAAGCGARSGLLTLDEIQASGSETGSGMGGSGQAGANSGFERPMEAGGSGAASGTPEALDATVGSARDASPRVEAAIVPTGPFDASVDQTAEASPSEEAGSDAGNDACGVGMSSCVPAACGDGIVEAPEECDDHNARSGDGCSATCRWEPRDVQSGERFHCALGYNGVLKCWGWNMFGQLGLGDTLNRGDQPGEMGDNLPAVNLGTGRSVRSVSIGTITTCALLDDESVKCWGDNEFGQLGLGDTTARGDQPGQMGDDLPAVSLGTGRTARAVSVGYGMTCALLDDGSVKCWGQNQEGELGLGDTANRGDQPGEMGDNLPAVSLGTGRTVRAIATQQCATCALLDDGSVKCWGCNYIGELGLGDTRNRGDQPGEMGDNLPAVDLGTGRSARAIVAGAAHICALLDDGSLKCWGYDSWGELGLGDSVTRGDQPGEMGDSLLPVALGTGRTAQAVAPGYAATCALLDDRSVKCWGDNLSGDLGLGDMIPRGDQPGQMGDNLPTVNLGTGRTAQVISSGYLASCALLDNGIVKCWGDNIEGELGLGDSESRGTEPGDMGDNLSAVDLTF